jgi:UDPglucose 6-dehydrogenase
MKHARTVLSGVEYANDAYSCMAGADALVIITEWEAFRKLDLKRVKSLLRKPVVADLRNIYRPDEMARLGFSYVSVGRPKVDAAG